MPAKPPSKGKKAAAPKASKAKAAKAPKPPVVEDEVEARDEPEDDEDLDVAEEEEGPRPAKVVKKPAAAVAAARPRPSAASASGDDAPAVVPARRLTPEAKARVNEMVRKGMSLADALKVAASWETFVAPVKDEPAKLVQGRMSGEGPRHSNFAGETEPEGAESDDEEEPAASEED